MSNYWPQISMAVEVALGIVAFLCVRWIAGIVNGLADKIRIAILELKDDLTKTYATKDELRRVEEKVNLSGELNAGFGQVLTLVSTQRRRRGAGTPGGGFQE